MHACLDAKLIIVKVSFWHANGVDKYQVKRWRAKLPGLTIDVETDNDFDCTKLTEYITCFLTTA